MYDPTKNTGYPGPPAYPGQQAYPVQPGYPAAGYSQPYGAAPYAQAPYQGQGYGQQYPGPAPVVGFQGFGGPQDASHSPAFVAGPQPSGGSGPTTTRPSDTETGVEGFSGSFGEKAIRQAFVRKVYSILSVQLLATLGFIALCIFVTDLKLWLRKNIWTYYLSYVIFLGTYIALVCCPGVRRKHPTNMIVLAVFTSAMAFMTGMISSFHNTQIVLMGIGITAAVTVIVTLFAINTKFDVTGCGMFLFIATLVLMVFGIACMIVFFVDRDAHRIMSVVYGALMALLFSMYLMYDVQQIMGGRKVEMSPEEHVYGAIQLYLDIVYIFLAILQISSFFSSN